MSLRDTSLGIYGLGVSGQSSLSYAAQHVMQVHCWDDNAEVREKLSETIKKAGARLTNFAEQGFAGVDCLLFSPGIPWNGQDRRHPAARLAEQAKVAGVEIICDIELLLRAKPWAGNVRLYGITGTNGKTSVVHWCEAITQQLGQSAIALGNNGSAALSAPKDKAYYFFELSSYQLDLMHAQGFDRAMLLNISPDHLDRYGTMAHYTESKARMRQLLNSQAATMVYGVDDPHTKALAEQAKAQGQKTLTFSACGECAGGVYLAQGQIIDDRQGEALTVMDLRQNPILNCKQHARNLVAVYALLVDAVLPDNPNVASQQFVAAVEQAVMRLQFDHRQNLVAYVDNILFVDDSKATNLIAAQDALSQFQHVYWIAGGQPKAGGFDGLGQDFSPLKGCYLIGEAMDAMSQYLQSQSLPEGVAPRKCGTLVGALQEIHQDIDPHQPACVLFSPGCASFDQFENYAHRGAVFQEHINKQWPKAEKLAHPAKVAELLKRCRYGL